MTIGLTETRGKTTSTPNDVDHALILQGQMRR